MARFSRRRLLSSGAAAGVLAATGLPMAAHARRGGTLRLATAGGHRSDGWDARTHADIFMICAAQGAVFDTLTEVSADGTLKGELAECWEASRDATVWTFDLRKGVTFHDGRPFGAKDVIASLDLHRAGSPASPIVASIAAMREVAPHQVQFVLEAGNVDFPYLLSDYHLLIYPADGIAEAMASGNGTGLYRVKRFEPGVRFLGTRVNGHYKDGEAGWFDEIELLAIADPRARLKALTSGRVDVAGDVDPAAVPMLRRNPRTELIEVAGNRHVSFPMATRVPPYDDRDIRMALKYAVDREAMVRDALLGHGSVGNDSPIGAANPNFHAGMAQIGYDPDRARFHLRRAGVDALSVALTVSDAAFVGADRAAESYRVSARRAGLTLDVVNAPADGYWDNAWRRDDWRASSWAGRATEDWMLSTLYTPGAIWNDTGWHHERFLSLMRLGRSEFDAARRREIYFEMQEILRDEGPTIVPMFAQFLSAKTRKVAHGGAVGGALHLDNGRIAERWWAA